jgi:hypothetical protein
MGGQGRGEARSIMGNCRLAGGGRFGNFAAAVQLTAGRAAPNKRPPGPIFAL